MTSETSKRARRIVEMAYGPPSDRTRPRWKKNGKRWVRSTPLDMPGPYFDLVVVALCVVMTLISLIV